MPESRSLSLLTCALCVALLGPVDASGQDAEQPNLIDQLLAMPVLKERPRSAKPAAAPLKLSLPGIGDAPATPRPGGAADLDQLAARIDEAWDAETRPESFAADLDTLARLAPARARDVLNKKLEGDAERVVEARARLVPLAVRLRDTDAAAEHRDALRKVIDEKQPGWRRAATALLEQPWEGRAAVVSSLFQNEGRELLLELLKRSPQAGADAIVSAIEAEHVELRHEALRFAIDHVSWQPALAPDAGPERRAAYASILGATLPWLPDPRWGPAEVDRSKIIKLLGHLEVTGCGEALNLYARQVETDAELRELVIAMGAQRDYRAGAALGFIADDTDDMGLKLLAKVAQAGCNALTVNDFIGALTAFTKFHVDHDREIVIRPHDPVALPEGIDLPTRLGYCYFVGPRKVVSIDDATPLFPYAEPIAPSRRHITALIEEIVTLREIVPRVTVRLRQLIPLWDDATSRQYAVFLIGEGDASAPLVRRVMANRPQYASDTDRKLKRIARRGGEPAGIAAAILDDADIIAHLLNSDDVDAQLALLATARIGRVQLDKADVEPLTRSENERLRRAASIYLDRPITLE